MPWSNQSGGPWGQKGGSREGGNNPWGSGRNGGGGGGGNNNEPPDLENLLRQSQDRLKSIFGGGGSGGGGGRPTRFSFGGKGALAILLLGVIVWLLNGIYTVRPNEIGVNMRFGEYKGSAGEGLNYNLPYPIGQVLKFDVTAQRRTEIGFRSSTGNKRTQDELLRESLMLTGDDNIVDVSFFVIWQIDSANISKYAFTLEDPAGTVKVVAESAMREVIGSSNIQSVITNNDQNAIAQRVQDIIQQALDSYNSGILIRGVQINAAVPPKQVREAFMDVNAAQQDAVRVQNEAERDASQILPKARGEAAEIIQRAEGYKARVTAEGNGQAVYFRDVYEAYRMSPDIIRERIFLETMENILKDSNKIVLDQNAQGSGAIPFLPLIQPDAKK